MPKIRVFTLNSNGKIELSKEELQQMLDESYQDGCNSVTITTPSYPSYPSYPCKKRYRLKILTMSPYSPFYCGPTSTESDSTANSTTVTATNNEN